jgi:serine/threonine-protein kinase
VHELPTRISPASSDDPSSTGGLTPPAELLAEASKRLGWAALIYAVCYSLAYFGPHVAAWLTLPNHRMWQVQHVFALLSVGLGSAVFILSRRSTLSAQRLLDIGLVFEVVGALGISAVEFWHGFPTESFLDQKFQGVPWECVWIIVFPMLAPNTPRKILIASLAAASTGPAIVAARWAAGVDMERSLPLLIVFFVSTTYLCAVLAYVVARIVYRYGVRLRKARDIGSYELVSRLGVGGMGEVWLGRHRMLARPAAVKLIRPELLGNDQRSRETARRRFEREAMATAALRSSHTIEVYDFGVTEDGAFFYVMEFLEGLTLEALVRRFGPIGPARSIYLLRQVCHSLGEAHARGIVHRDIKPANIFSCRLGPDCDFVKVLDFGLVKETGDAVDTGIPTLTAQGVTTGTPGFMAPEVALARPDIDGRADIYAVGCVAYWLLTGQPVFKRETPVATLLAHVRDEPLPPSTRTELSIPAALDNLVVACLAKDPAARPPGAVELARLLDGIELPPWTADDARRWWALHGPMGTLSAIAADERTPEAVVYAKR